MSKGQLHIMLITCLAPMWLTFSIRSRKGRIEVCSPPQSWYKWLPSCYIPQKDSSHRCQWKLPAGANRSPRGSDYPLKAVAFWILELIYQEPTTWILHPELLQLFTKSKTYRPPATAKGPLPWIKSGTYRSSHPILGSIWNLGHPHVQSPPTLTISNLCARQHRQLPSSAFMVMSWHRCIMTFQNM